MPFGSLYFAQFRARSRPNQLTLTSIEIRGKQYAAINNSVVTMKYYQPYMAPMCGYFYLPVDNDICVHTMKLTCEGREIVFVCRESAEARQTFESAHESGHLCSLVNSCKDRVTKVELGNIPPATEIILSLNMTLIAASSSPKSIFFKFPLESCNPNGIIVTFDFSKIQHFVFEQEIEGIQDISIVKSSHGGEWIRRNDQTGIFHLTQPTSDGSIILTTTFVDRMNQTAIQFGDIVCGFIIPDD
jgi:hypothetical protein